ncbi:MULTISPECIES: hypothetical protein [Aliiglaciecola]|uniref:hypothetical protein n=1 Tax=Aliiglaciecola TaxID=1406885 RepID=UPI001C0982FA|nr:MULTISPECIES: hypothetical protein [Aliiglaciecola]MBU2878452.1 hypothetical protein [Aliiglaciecola lipolytica]MDO6712922.1 hypothetical protein [Aliiglaciecola sp. 2_MG-2023]MDO6753961.1 hypothetical protein [Aliiglaciecola sp. 1_MG-2023]
MNKWLLGAAVTAIYASVSYAQEAADPDTVADMLQYCLEVAAEDGTGDLSKQEFVLNCVNEELESEGFTKITALPKKV